MVMPREEFASGNTETSNDTSEKAGDTPSKAVIEVHDEEDKAIKQSCVRWADIVKKGRCKRPVPPVMGGAEKHSWLKSIQDWKDLEEKDRWRGKVEVMPLCN